MLQAAMGWLGQSHPRKKFIANGVVAFVVLFLVFYYISWTTLQTSHGQAAPAVVERTKQAQLPLLTTARSCPPAPSPSSCPPPPPPPSPYDLTKVAFLAETRPLPHLPALFAHMTAIIPPEWTFRFMGSNDSISFLRSIPTINRLESVGKLTILPLPSKYTLTDRETISQMFTDIELYKTHLAPAEHLLVFQPDAIFCANSPHTLNDFLEWDWIGAPWSKTAVGGGNGGLSLRKVSRIIKVLEGSKRREGDGLLEDAWLSYRLARMHGAKTPTADVSKTFSVESVWDDTPLGYHIGWLGVHHEQIWDDEDQVRHVMKYCPEVKIILGMKLDGDKPEAVEKFKAS